jgi:putative tryptophan/tyrosine transport system substrate-binding protein
MGDRMRADRVKRREFITLLGSAAAAWPLVARAQSPRPRPLIAWLSGGAPANSQFATDAFLQGMRDLGYIEGRSFDIIYRFADGYAERLPALAEELVRLKPNVILAAATGQAVAAKNATTTIPIVTPALADAVHLGLVASDARPGGNVTGITPYVAGLPAKQMELAREVVPGARRIGVLNDIIDPKASPQWQELEAVGRSLGVSVVAADVRTPDDLVSAMQSLANQRLDAAIVLQTTMLLSERQKIAALAEAMRLPVIYGYREHVVAGGLISYGVDLRDCFRRAAVYVLKILDGTAPGDLPVEFPTKLELIINLKTAKAIGLDISPVLLARADEVIE